MSTEQTLNPDIELELLFEHDGCKIYRFSDVGRSIYYTDCRGQTSWETTYTDGKITTTTNHQVNTEE